MAVVVVEDVLVLQITAPHPLQPEVSSFLRISQRSGQTPGDCARREDPRSSPGSSEGKVHVLRTQGVVPTTVTDGP